MFDGSFLDYILWLPTVYLGFSIGEWLVHRHMMHEAIYQFIKPLALIGDEKFWYPWSQLTGRHVTHHRLTNNDDMTIEKYKYPRGKKKYKKNEIVLSVEFQGKNSMEEYQNLYFVWPTTIIMLIPHLIFVAIFNYYVYKVSYKYAFATDVLFVIVHSAIWNCMHPMLHEFDRRLRWYEGIDFIPRDWFRSTRMYKFLWKNHVLHHIVTGKHQCNFNIALPLADWLFGTYRSDYSKKYKLDCDNFKIIKIAQK